RMAEITQPEKADRGPEVYNYRAASTLLPSEPIQTRICRRRCTSALARPPSAPRQEGPKRVPPALLPAHRVVSVRPVPPPVRALLLERRTSARVSSRHRHAAAQGRGACPCLRERTKIARGRRSDTGLRERPRRPWPTRAPSA